jgi:FdhD protein
MSSTSTPASKTEKPRSYRPQLSSAGLSPTQAVQARDEFNNVRDVHIAGEAPLTLKVDEREIVTLMTLGTRPEALALGYLRNQRLIEDLTLIDSVTVDWGQETAHIRTHTGAGLEDADEKLAKRTVTSGCGQGTVFSCTVDEIYATKLPEVTVKQSTIYGLLRTLSEYNDIYNRAGAVHGCAITCGEKIVDFVEDVGRHNAADALAGEMWLNHIDGADKWFYTTGRLTSEMVMKAAFMGIPVLVSRSGITQMGLELAEVVGMVMVARAKGRHFLVYNGAQQVVYDAIPKATASARP